MSAPSYPVLYAPGGELIGRASTEAGAVRCASGIQRSACERMTARLAERWVDDGESFELAGLAWFAGPQLVQDKRVRRPRLAAPAAVPQGRSGSQDAGAGQPGESAPVLCARCIEHAGKPLHWCVWLVTLPGGRAAACECPCERRRSR